MHKHYKNYGYKDGLPFGINALSDDDVAENISFKIVSDPYMKRISVEKYFKGVFETTIYDSNLLNFRHLNESELQTWQKKVVKQEDNFEQCLICNQDDRVIFIESYFFDDNVCKKCVMTSPQGVHLCTQIMNDAKVILYDSNNNIVIEKDINK